jgi:ribosome biogenesis GTPase / thiamine phosphate phosphatase
LEPGTVIRAAGGYFSVRKANGDEYLCRARGNLKRDNQALLVGDRVLFQPPEDRFESEASEGLIEERLPRFNELLRPTVANIDQMVVVMSLRQPTADWQLVSRLFVMAEKENMKAILCLNKTDLVTSAERNEILELLQPYPYQVIYCCALSGEGINELSDGLKDKYSVLSGPSGVGKSSLLNALQPGLSLQTGLVSDKIKRGKHTTRQAELLPLDRGGAVVDTPGFTRLDFADLDPEELPALFPEFQPYLGQCGFRNCLHLSETHCAIQDNLGDTINILRYGHYKYFMKEINNRQEVY